MKFETDLLENSEIKLIDGDRGKNYPKQADFSEDGFCLFLSAKNVTTTGFNFSETSYISSLKDELLRAGKLQRGDIVVTTRGTIGNVAYYGDDIPFDHIRINSGMMIFRADEHRWNRRFLYFLLTSNFIREQVQSLTSGSAVPQLPARDLKKFSLPNIPKNIQDKIEKIVGDLADKIELNRQTNQTLEHIAQALFKCWFVDFEPTRAKIIAKEKGANTAIQELAAQAIICGAMTLEQLEAITQNLETTLQQAINEKLNQANQTPINTEQLKTTAALFPNALVESDGVTNSSGTNLHERSEPEGGGSGTSRLIPEGWHWSEIGDEVVVAGGGTPSTKKEEFWEGGHIHWTSPKDMSNLTDKILLETSRKITDVGLAKISSGLLPENTVLMSSRAPVGYLAITKIPVAINQGYIAMKCEGTLSPEYIVQWAESSMDDIKQRASGTTFAEISKKTFKIIPVVVPSKEAINAYTLVVAKLYSKITESLIEIKSLIEIRDSLLPKLLSGELNVSSD